MLFKDLIELVKTVKSEAADHLTDLRKKNQDYYDYNDDGSVDAEWDLYNAFNWRSSPQGHDYWQSLENEIQSEGK